MNLHKEETMDEWFHKPNALQCSLRLNLSSHHYRGKLSLLTGAAVVRGGVVLSVKDPLILMCMLMT